MFKADTYEVVRRGKQKHDHIIFLASRSASMHKTENKITTFPTPEGQLSSLAGDLPDEPADDLDGHLDEAHRQVRRRRAAHAARAHAAQRRPTN